MLEMSRGYGLPHQVEILETGISSPVCVGTIISSYLILTVASCFAGKNLTSFKIRVDGHNNNDQERTMADVYSYPAQGSDPSDFDVAVVLLSSSLDGTYFTTWFYDPIESEDPGKRTCRAFLCRRDREMSNVTTTGVSACAKEEEQEDKNFVCTSPASTQGSNASCSLPLPGSGLVCSQNRVDLLCGLLVMEPSNAEAAGVLSSGKRLYRKISGYAPWINLALQQARAERDSGEDYFDIGHLPVRGTVVDRIKNPVPYQLSLQRNGAFHCGGIILDKKTALTAAHCFDNSKVFHHYTLFAGEHNLIRFYNIEQVLEIEKVFIHPNYKPYHLFQGNDIAVIHVKGEFNFIDRVNNVWISSQSTPDFQDVNVTGVSTSWGESEPHGLGYYSKFLQSVDLNFMDHSQCKRQWTFLKDSMFCGYNNASNVCAEAGEPLFVQNYVGGNGNGNGKGPHTKSDLLVGISSFGPTHCYAQNEPHVFTNVSHYYEWIAKSRSNSLCPPTELQCFNGECIEKELRCDKKYDCEDGSDEKVCKSHSPVTRSCGGLINLAHSHQIQWTAPTSHPNPNSNCLWVIVNSHVDRPTTTQINIIDDEPMFDATASQLYVLQNLTGNQLSTTQLNETYFDYNFSQPILMLYFRTNSTRENSGIHLQITDATGHIARSVADLSAAEEFMQETSQSQSLSHVYSGSHCKSKTKSRHILRNAPPQVQPSSSNSQNPPYIVSIQLNGEHLCTGVILDKKTVLSTAGCFDWQDEEGQTVDLRLSLANRTKGVRIVAGEQNLSRADSTEQIIEVDKLVQHEKWIHPRVSGGNDIAIIHLKSDLTFNAHVSNIWISSPDNLNLEGATGSLSAWITPNRSVSDFLPDLKTLNMDVLKNSECKKKYRFLKESMICGSQNSASVCGMNGAPLVLKAQTFGNSTRDVLVGLSALEPSSCEIPKRPVGFTRVDYFYDWIEENRANSICPASEFQCYNGECIDKELKCNYVFDCSDGSDESVCQSESESESSTTIRQLDSCTRRHGNGSGSAPAAQRSNARDQENVFVFLKPVEDGGRIQVGVDSLQMETAQDSLSVISYRQNTQEMIHLDRLQGVGSWFNRTFEGDENEPVLVYFHARPGNQNQKMDLSYIEKRRIEPTTTSPETSSSCEGNQTSDLEELLLQFFHSTSSSNSTEDLKNNITTRVAAFAEEVMRCAEKMAGVIIWNLTQTVENLTSKIQELEQQQKKRNETDFLCITGNQTETRTTLAEPQGNSSSFPPAAAWGFEAFDESSDVQLWNYNATADGACLNFKQRIGSVEGLLGPSCVILYQEENCSQGKSRSRLQLDTKNFPLELDMQINFAIPEKSPKSIGVCS